jgi:hypothetical protein
MITFILMSLSNLTIGVPSAARILSPVLKPAFAWDFQINVFKIIRHIRIAVRKRHPNINNKRQDKVDRNTS